MSKEKADTSLSNWQSKLHEIIFEADEKGNGTITFTTDQWCIGCGDPNKDIMGKAVIVHEGTDDFTTQPTGAAGGRVSCGAVIE